MPSSFPASVWSPAAGTVNTLASGSFPAMSKVSAGVNPNGNLLLITQVLGSITEHLLATVVSPSVPKRCFKATLPCKLSPLGFHLSLNVKEKESRISGYIIPPPAFKIFF